MLPNVEGMREQLLSIALYPLHSDGRNAGRAAEIVGREGANTTVSIPLLYQLAFRLFAFYGKERKKRS